MRATKSTLVRILDVIPFKPDSPFSTALLRHYVEGSGDPVSLNNVPDAWQQWIMKQTRQKPGHYHDVSPYDVGLYDLQNSLGHFDLDVVRNGDGTRLYSISDTYEFGYKKNDRQARHGFPLGDLGDRSLWLVRKLLPSGTYWNPGGFEEKWEVKRIGRENILFIPQQFLAEQGAPFDVRASFRR